MSAAEGTVAAQAGATGLAGTVESMDCLVSVTESGGGRVFDISGSGAVRFKGAIESRITSVLDGLEGDYPGKTRDLKITVQDNGAMDVVLGARVEAAFVRYAAADGGGSK